MDCRYNYRNTYARNSFGSIGGKIVEMMPYGIRGNNSEACMTMVTVEDEDGGITNFIVTPATYVVDFLTLEVGMMCTFWYRLDAPAPLIYPPQYNAEVVAMMQDDRSIDVSRFDNMLVNETGTLQLNLGNSNNIFTTNNQRFQGSPANRELVVIYDMSTRSIPAQTTPKKVIVLCRNN